MRLIDADAFLERFEKMCETELDNVIAIILKGALINEPTAFDADKVIDQLGERSMLSTPMGIVTLKDAIEIVKRGGKE